MFDPDDIDAAFAELDARYRDGEAATHAHTWSVVAGAYATLNLRQIPAATPDCVNVDHRGGIAYEGAMVPCLNATWDVAPHITMRIEQCIGSPMPERLLPGRRMGPRRRASAPNGGAQHPDILTVEGDLISRGEIFDEADLDAALARFDELSPPAPKDLPAGRGSNTRPPD